MNTSLSQVTQSLLMINQEGGAMPGEPLTAIETFTYFVAAPVLMFIVISALSWIASAPKKDKSAKSSDYINQIQD